MLIFSPNIDAPAALPSYNHRQKEKKKEIKRFYSNSSNDS